MIKEFSVRPKPTNNKAKVIFGAVLFASMLAFITYFLVERYKGLVGLAAMLILVTAILIYTKYISATFIYDLTVNSDDRPIFVVRQVVGKRYTTLFYTELTEVESVKMETREQRKAHVTQKGTLVFTYAPTVSPEIVCRITSSAMGRRSEIIVEVSDQIANTILDYVNEAKMLYGEKEE